ncbi:MAG: EAL domain-containing protein [Clostridia bacterium]|nr:EAL domain-containing protein [Clostridia bacterium]
MKKQILIVEDNELNRAMLSEILSDEYQVLEAETGQEALDVLHCHSRRIALILLDVVMPVMDGYTFLNIIKDDEELSLIPVIVMTQSGSEADEVAALAHGATDFVPKPYRPQVILHRVASLIKLRENAAMVNQIKFDRLTGLYNKEFFYKKVREKLDSDPEGEYSITFSNIENFKLYNDIFGVESGDKLLREIAVVMQKLVGEDGICCRYGADRFLYLDKLENERAARQKYFNKSFSDFFEGAENISFKWGTYEITDRSVPVEQMCDRAMLAVNSIKGQYDQSFALYDDSLREKLLREKTITSSMENSLAEGHFIVYYQPKYNINNNCMAGAEALVRWIHPKWGFMSPGEFIPLFEKNGFITQLDQYVWEQVCIHIHEWLEKGYPIMPVSVNVSRADVYKGNLVDTLLKLTKKYDIDPSYLHLEITESAYSETTGPIITTVEELRRLNFIVEMDDFGSGYSSLNMLSQIKLDVLKLDMQFIRNETAKPENQSILNDVISMAHRISLSVVAEGVEFRDQVDRLLSVGCDYIQGYYFAKPMPVTEYEGLLKNCLAQTDNSSSDISLSRNNKYSLLIVDEDAEYREKVRKAFESQYQIIEASNLESAISCIRSCKSVLTVILSMTLPDNDAASLIKTLRQNPAFWNIPVLASIPEGNCAAKLPMAMETDDFICKCHPLPDIKRRIQRLMEKAASNK